MNPYRMAEPRTGVIFSGRFCYADRKGRIDDSAGAARVAMTREYLWVNENLSIPLASIYQVENLNRKAVGIAFHNAVSDAPEAIWLAARDWLGLRDKERNDLFASAIEEARKRAPSVEQFATTLRDDIGTLKVGCEVCGGMPAQDLELGWFFCFGVLPFAGVYKWQPVRRLLCGKHAGRACITNNVVTGLIGYWGFPGVLVAPFRVWRNVRELRQTFGVSTSTAVVNAVFGFLAPAALCIWIVFEIVRREAP